MGIQSLYKLLLKEGVTIKDIGVTIRLSDLKGQRLCFDASNIIYSSLLALSNVSTLTDKNGKPTGHINTVFNKVVMFAKHGIQQLWIFDNPKQNPFKVAENERREKRRAKSKNPKAQFRMTSEHVNDIIKLLTLMGVPYIIAPEGFEAEHYGALICESKNRKGLCYAMVSNDGDVLMWGTQLKEEKEDKKKVYKLYSNEAILSESGLTREEFVKLCIAMGSDFAPKTRGVGPKTAIKKLSKITLTEEQEAAKRYILSKVPMQASDIKINEFNESSLLQYLIDYNFDENRMKNAIEFYKNNK